MDVSFTGIEGEAVPDEFALDGNYPNPFNSVNRISYDVPERANVTIEVFNTVGKLVATLVNDTKSELCLPALK